MPMSQNTKECGWFYHAPAKREPGKPRTEYPAPSNIPGIGYDDPESLQKEAVREVVFRETDSEYIRLAKMGGRKDLLSFNPDRNWRKSAGPSGYPRNEWFYVEDNRIEDEEKKAEEKKSWNFLLPDYMVHRSYKPSFEEPGAMPTRHAAPYYTEATSVIKDEGRSACDKTVKIAENRRPGYGVRNQKPPQVTQKLLPREKPSRPQNSQALPAEHKKSEPQVVMPTEREEPTSMSKLLAGEYEKQWYTKRAEMLQHKFTFPEDSPGGAPEVGITRVATDHQRHENVDMEINGLRRRRPEEEDAEKELFKLNRFKNIPSKLDSHQRPEMLTTVK